MASDHRSTTQQEPTRTHFGSEESKQPDSATKTSSKGRARNKSGKKNPKKPAPQRGVGVAQLERLRLQQRWNKLTQMPLPQTQVVQSLNLPENQRQQFQHYQNPTTTRPDPLLSVPVLYGASNYDGPRSSSSGLVVQSVNANGGFCYGYNVRAHNDVGGLVVDPNQYGVGAPNPYRIGAGVPTSGAVYEISNDLSSIPKMKQQPSSSSSSSEYCCCCKQVYIYFDFSKRKLITCLVSEKTWENKSEILELFICLIHYYSIFYTVLKMLLISHFLLLGLL